MAQPALARKAAAPIFPEQVEVGTLLKLKSRDSDNFTIVEMLRATTSVAGVFEVLAWDSAETCTLHVDIQMLDRGPASPKQYFLRADIATPDEVAEYIETIRHEIGLALAKKQAHQSRFEEKVGKRLPIPK